MKKFILLSILFTAFQGFSQIPSGYYDDAEGLNGDALRSALQEIIEDHSSQSYSSLWTHFQSTDQKPNGEVWDMYSDNPDGPEPFVFQFGSDQCGNYGGEGDCYNREHSFPKSWFGDQSPMNTDLFHLYPTDGYTNGIRSNHPYGETDSPTYTSENGSKRGTSSVTGFVGTVFEPIDEYKGDFARTYFYMLTRYMDQVDGWSSFMLQDDDFSAWALTMLMEWHEEDPVSQKEIDRNNAVYDIQNNRNPFIDDPEFVDLIWGEPIGVEEAADNDFDMWWSEGTVHFSDNVARAELFVYSTTGQLVMKKTVSGNSVNQLDLDNGMYIIQLHTGSTFEVLRVVR
ncbi:endonuclease [Halocola ammonii]